MKKLFSISILLISMIFVSCGSDENPVQPDTPIFQQSGLIDSLRISINGYSAHSLSLFSNPFDFSSLETVRLKFNYTKSGSENTPIMFGYMINNDSMAVLYSLTDSIKTTHSASIETMMTSPKKSVTLVYTIRARKLASDSSGYISLSDVGLWRK